MSEALSEPGSGPRVAIVGAGIGGLTTAFRLQEKGLNTTVFEAEGKVGGRMTTLRKGGYNIDLAASIFPDTYTRMMPLIEDAGLLAEVEPTSDLVGILRDGIVHRTRSHSKIDGLKTGLLSAKGKLALTKALFDAARYRKALSWYDLGLAADLDFESAADYARRRLNDEVLEYIVSPACRAVCLASPEKVSKVDFLFALRNILGGRLFNSRTGADFLPEGLARSLNVQLNSNVLAVEENAGQVSLTVQGPEGSRTEGFDACVIALPAPQMLKVHKTLAKTQREAAGQIHYTQPLGVHFGLSSPLEDEAAILIQIPEASHPHLSAVLLEHNKAPGRVPMGKGMLTTVWQHQWGVTHWQYEDDKVADIALEGLKRTLPQLVTDVDLVHVQRWQHGPVMVGVGCYKNLARLTSVDTRANRVQLVGDYFSSTSTHASLCRAEQVAENIAGLFARV